MPELKKTPIPVRETLLLICEKCGKRMVGNSDVENPSTLLQQKLKSEVKTRCLKGRVRPILTSCLDICPENEVAIGHVQVDSTTPRIEFFTVTCEEPDETAQMLIDRFYPKA